MYLNYLYFILEELTLSGHEKYHKTWKDDFENAIRHFILPEIPCYVLYRYNNNCFSKNYLMPI